MLVDLTVAAPGGETDVRIEVVADPARAAHPVTFAAARPAITAVLGLPAGASFYRGARPIADADALGEPGLRTGSRLTTTPLPEPMPAPYQVQVLGGPTAGAVHDLRRGELVLGRSTECDIVLGDERASRRHAVIVVGPGGLSIRDLESTNGTTVDGAPVPPAGLTLPPGSIVRIGDSLLVVAALAIDAARVDPTALGGLRVHRPPRMPLVASTECVDLPAPPVPIRASPVQWLAALLPAAASGGLAWLTHSWVFLTFGLLTPLMLLSSALGDRVHWRRARRTAAREHRRADAAARRDLEAELVAEVTRRRDAHPDPPTVAAVASTPGTRLWERRPGDPDWLTVRIGSAVQPAELTVRRGTDSMTSCAGDVGPVPFRLCLDGQTVGVAGPVDTARGVVRWLVGQLATWHSPDDLEIVLLLDRTSDPQWRWARWLPHVRAVTTPDEVERVVAELAGTVHGHSERACVVVVDRPGVSPVELTGVLYGGDPGRGTHGPSPHDIATPSVSTHSTATRSAATHSTATRSAATHGTSTPGVAAPEATACRAGVATLVLAPEARALPEHCRATVLVARDGTAEVRDAAGDPALLSVDTVPIPWCDTVARHLSPLTAPSAARRRPTPRHCTLLDCAGLTELTPEIVRQRWARSSGRPDTVLGREGGAAFRVDLAADGPHALIAGTTGSGKSRLLQTLVAGLALDHPPSELTFLLVDFKGGAAFAACSELPHCAGLVTDLDPATTQRALRSLDAELHRRERALLAAGVADLDALAEQPAAPRLPRLIIVVDEFAALAEELPDFVTGLVGLANRGRSLGLHLVLATQRPGSVVSAQIRANTSLRIALRMADPVESVDVVGIADAAAIPATIPGRAVVRTADACATVQVAEVAGPPPYAPGTLRIHRLDAWRRPHRDDTTDAVDLEDVVATLRATASLLDLPAAAPPWCPPLAARLTSDAPRPGAAPSPLVLGRRDDPDRQSQPPLYLDVDAGESLLLLGGPRSGRTTALASLAVECARRPGRPTEVHVVSADGRLATLLTGLPGLASVLGPGDLATTGTLLERLVTVPPSRAARLLLIDGWETVLGAHDDLAALDVGRHLAVLLRSPGRATLALTGDRSLLAPRFAGAFAHRWALRFADPADVAALGIRIPPPVEQPPGRGIAAADGLVFQLAVPGPLELPVDGALHAAVADLRERNAHERQAPERRDHERRGAAWHAPSVLLRALPPVVRLADLPAVAGPQLRLGIGGDAAATVTVDPFAGARRWLVTGPPRSGRTATLGVWLAEAVRCHIPVLAAGPPRSALLRWAAAAGVPVVLPHGDTPPRPADATLLLVDDAEAFVDTPSGDALLGWLAGSAPLAVVLSGRGEDLAVAYRGLAAEVRRSRAGIALRPEPVDAEVFGVRLPRSAAADPCGRGRLVPDDAWSLILDTGAQIAPLPLAPVQIARCENPAGTGQVPSDFRPDQPMCGYR